MFELVIRPKQVTLVRFTQLSGPLCLWQCLVLRIALTRSATYLIMSEKLCLKWNDFQENVNTAFTSLREDKEFSDVTLVCEDGHQLEAHKVILVASSPFFLNILKKSRHPHPLVYMKGQD